MLNEAMLSLKDGNQLTTDLSSLTQKSDMTKSDHYDLLGHSTDLFLNNLGNHSTKSENTSQNASGFGFPFIIDHSDFDGSKTAHSDKDMYDVLDVSNQFLFENYLNDLKDVDCYTNVEKQYNQDDMLSNQLDVLSLLDSTSGTESGYNNHNYNQDYSHYPELNQLSFRNDSIHNFTISNDLESKHSGIFSNTLSQNRKTDSISLDLDHSQVSWQGCLNIDLPHHQTNCQEARVELPLLNPVASRRKVQYRKTRLCPWFFSGKCLMGDQCNYAHDQSELRGRPDLTRTRFCPNIDNCTDPSCRFAHYNTELRATGAFYRTKMCKFWQQGFCTAGAYCRHAHGFEQIRDPFDDVHKTSTPSTKSTIRSSDLNIGFQEQINSKRFEQPSSCLTSQGTSVVFMDSPKENNLYKNQSDDDHQQQTTGDPQINIEVLYNVLKVLLLEQQDPLLLASQHSSHNSTIDSNPVPSSEFSDSITNTITSQTDNIDQIDNYNSEKVNYILQERPCVLLPDEIQLDKLIDFNLNKE